MTGTERTLPADPKAAPPPRCVLITTPPTRWVLQVEDDWDGLNEDERQSYIYEAAMDNDKLPRFRWETLP